MKTIEFYDEIYPAKNIVCPRCDGDGTHTNPSIDGNGLTHSDIEEIMVGDGDEDFLDDYFGGRYDVACEECNGKRVILEVDEDMLTAEQTARYNEDLQDEQNSRMEREAERRAGC